MQEDLLTTVMNLGSPKVLVAGDFMLDIYIYGDALRISPEAPVPVLKVTNTEYRCGGAGLVAADLAALGAMPYCLGIIGDEADHNTTILRSKLADAGTDTAGLLSAAGRETITKQRVVGLAQHRHPQQLIRIDQELAGPFSDEQYARLLQLYKATLSRVDIVCLQDYNKGLLSPALCREMIRLAAEAGKRLLVDPCLTSDYSKYVGATLITPNRKEASQAVGFEIKDTKAAAKAADRLLAQCRLDAVVITLDKEGAYLQSADGGRLVPTKARSVYDVTGAGDMVLATLTAALAAGYDYQTAVQLANVTGGMEVEKFGSATITVEEIINEISGKVLATDGLLTRLTWHRLQDKTIVFTNGCFDVVHRGHIEYLKFCKGQGDIVVVGLNSDNSVRTIKGPERPINNEHDRAAVLAAMEAVDYITVFDEPTPLDLIKKVKPDVLVKGEDWAEKGVVGRGFVESHGGKVVLAPLVEGKSSTATIEKMNSLTKSP
jgi:D-beta-D-heptose 7-phosphate kinase/D-beta-D-heptose 1-phosphate adenosyltransferase